MRSQCVLFCIGKQCLDIRRYCYVNLNMHICLLIPLQILGWIRKWIYEDPNHPILAISSGPMYYPQCTVPMYYSQCTVQCTTPNVLYQCTTPNVLYQCTTPNVLYQCTTPNVLYQCTTPNVLYQMYYPQCTVPMYYPMYCTNVLPPMYCTNVLPPMYCTNVLPPMYCGTKCQSYIPMYYDQYCANVHQFQRYNCTNHHVNVHSIIVVHKCQSSPQSHHHAPPMTNQPMKVDSISFKL